MTQILSKRAQDFLHYPVHIKNNFLKEASKDSPKWDFSFENESNGTFQSDKILTLCYFYPSASELEMLFMEALARLVVKKNFSFLEKLTFRELENYLRDENHLPVFDKSNLLQVEHVYKVVKTSLLAEIILKKIKNISDYHVPQKSWPDLQFVEKNRELKVIISLLNSLFVRGKELELALASDCEILVAMNEFPIAIEVIEEVLKALLVIPDGKSSLKVVAVQ